MIGPAAASGHAGGLVSWTLLPPEVGSLSVVNNHCIEVDQL